MEREKLICSIVEIELEMFLNVNAEGDPSCRERPDDFKMHRESQFSVWSDKTLRSYLEDLNLARAYGRNLMTYKYARMDDLVPCANNSPIIEEILDIQMAWQREVISQYPLLMKNGRGLTDADESSLPVSFERYLRAELESYSVTTLENLRDDIQKMKADGVNMSEKIYMNLVGNLGLNSLESFK